MDAAIAGIASQQHGVFSRQQALAAGLSRSSIHRRLSSGEWELLHPTVYALAGTPATWYRSQSAACLWSRGASARRAAGFLHALPGCAEPPVEILTTRRQVMPHAGIVVHYTRRLPLEQVVRRRGIPTTSIERTLMDLCGHLTRRRAAIALDDALRRGLTTLGSLDRCLYLTARRGRNGCGILRDLVHARLGAGTPHSPLETVIFEMLQQSGLPMPNLQHEIRDESGVFVARPDFVYSDERLIIEGHSKQWHWGVRAETEDLERHNRLAALSYLVLYITWQDATTNRDQTLTLIERTLDERRHLFM